MKVNFDLDWVVYRGGLAGDKRWHRVQVEGEPDPREYEKGVHKKTIIKELEESGTINYTFLEKGRESDPFPLVFNNCVRMIQTVLKKIKYTDIQFFISPRDGSNWRTAYAKELPYKGNRKNADKPYYYNEIHDRLIEKYDAFVCTGFEADDYVSYLQDIDGPSVLVDNDKDTDMIPGRHYSHSRGKYVISEEEGRHNFYVQLLTGDSADNIGGLRGVGPKKANWALEGCESIDEYDNRVYSTYEVNYGEKALELMIERGNLLWMPRPHKEMYIPGQRLMKRLGLTYTDIAKYLPQNRGEIQCGM